MVNLAAQQSKGRMFRYGCIVTFIFGLARILMAIFRFFLTSICRLVVTKSQSTEQSFVSLQWNPKYLATGKPPLCCYTIQAQLATARRCDAGTLNLVPGVQTLKKPCRLVHMHPRREYNQHNSN
ncbi:hypothetical protein FOXYSP1_05516 [Fusarium oxysporum f. sp. phaseoli]